MGYMNFFPLEPQEPSEEYNDNTPNKKIESQTQNTSEELWNILKNEEEESIEIKDIKPIPVKDI